MPYQVLVLSEAARELLDWLQDGPLQMTRQGVGDSEAAQQLIRKGLAVYEDGALRLLKDAKPVRPRDD